MPRKKVNPLLVPKTRKRIQGVPQLTDYPALVRRGAVKVCAEQRQLIDMVFRAFAEERLVIDVERLAAYKGYEALFPFDLYPLEWFILTCWLCVFREDGTPRWPDLLWYTGRGSGKNGFISFAAFCLITSANGIREYDISICATSEDQAKTSFDEVVNVLKDPANVLRTSKGFHWTKEVIESRSTMSKIRYRTNNSKTKDGGREGCVIFDEVHAYQDRANLNVFMGGLGKKRHPRTAMITTDGDIRDGVLDEELQDAAAILAGELPDNGTLPVICRLESEAEVYDESCWEKAIPRLPYAGPEMLTRVRSDVEKWKRHPERETAVLTKRFNLPARRSALAVAKWEDIKATARDNEVPPGTPCVVGIDYAKTTDFVCVTRLHRIGEGYVGELSSWWCVNSADAGYVKFPLDEAAREGLLVLVDEVEVSPERVAEHVAAIDSVWPIERIGIDQYRYTLLQKALKERGFYPEREGGIVKLVRPSDQMLVQPVIESVFANRRIAMGDNRLWRWFTNNAILEPAPNGNYKYGKQDPHSRKTDGFMSFVHAFAVTDMEPEPEPVEFLPPMVL